MIVILKNGAAEEKKNQLIDWLKEQGLQIHTSVGEYQTVLGLVGDTSRVDMDLIASLGIVDSVKRVTGAVQVLQPQVPPGRHRRAGRGRAHRRRELRDDRGPVQRRERGADRRHRKGGQGLRRADPSAAALSSRAPRPTTFRALRATGLELLKIARQETGLPIVTEIMGTSALDLFADVDVIQVGARNMQNFDLLKELGKAPTSRFCSSAVWPTRSRSC